MDPNSRSVAGIVYIGLVVFTVAVTVAGIHVGQICWYGNDYCATVQIERR